MVVIESHYGHEQDMIDRVTQHKALKNLRCVKEGRVVALPLYAIYSSGVRTYDGIKLLRPECTRICIRRNNYG